jgi:hypothetical protein
MRIPAGGGYESRGVTQAKIGMNPRRPQRPPLFTLGVVFMTSPKDKPADVAVQICRALKTGGSSEHAAGVQWFFKDEIKSHGWYTADLRRAMRRCRREILLEHDFDFLVEVADKLFSRAVLEEKVAAVFLLEKMDAQFGDREFRRFEKWLDRIASWADHDALVHDLIAPMMAAKPSHTKAVFRWAKARNQWHRGRLAWR